MLRRSNSTPRPGPLFAAIAVADSVVIAAGTIIDEVANRSFYLACGFSIAAVILLVGLLYHALTIRKGNITDGIRDAIACTFLLVYLLLVVYAVFFKTASPNETLSPQTTSLLASFTSVTAIVVGFYFATGSFDKFVEHRKTSDTRVKSESDVNSAGRLPDQTDNADSGSDNDHNS